MTTPMGRRTALQLLGAAPAMAFSGGGHSLQPQGMPSAVPAGGFVYCLNTATIRGQNLGLVKELETVAKAGYQGIEIWIDTLHAYMDAGGKTADLKKRAADLGLTIENAIGFAPWIVDDDAKRQKGLDQLKREMGLLAAIGCQRIAAPPAGATDTPGLDLLKAADRYRVILELGDQSGVVPQLELWGFSANLHRLSEVIYVAVQSGHPKAKLLLDNYHLYKGGTRTASLHLIDPSATDIFHMNDFPDIPEARITDADRVMPGDGVSPLKAVLRSLASASRPVVLSVEIFNKGYYAQDAAEVASLALKKMKQLTEGL